MAMWKACSYEKPHLSHPWTLERAHYECPGVPGSYKEEMYALYSRIEQLAHTEGDWVDYFSLAVLPDCTDA